MVGLFVLCALLPVAALAVLGYTQVRRQLVAQSSEQLAQAAKTVGMGVIDELRVVRLAVDDARDAARAGHLAEFARSTEAARARSLLATVMLVRDSAITPAWGPVGSRPALPPHARATVDSGGTALVVGTGDSAVIWLVTRAGVSGMLWASPRMDQLFAGTRERASISGGETSVCIREAGGPRIECPSDDAGAGARTASWQIFLGYDYGAPSWDVVVRQDAGVALAPITTFRRTFLATLVAMLGLVVAISAAQVRRSLKPLQALKEGTARLARRDFDTPVRVASRDEFEDLAASFNSMGTELAQQFAANTQLIGRLEELSYGALSALARAVDASSHWTAGHSERVTSLSMRMAVHLGLEGGSVETLRRGGLLHDIGKIGISPDILDKPGRLTIPELQRIQQHPALGARILAPLEAFADAVPIVLHHHERFDGAGYPHGLKGEGIPRLARLLAVADVYDALVSSRPYRAGWDHELALETIRDSSGTHFDPAMVDLFFQVIESEGDAARFALTLEGSRS
jgi:putative nucleotidyltransferase with HDIG domain